MSAPSRVPVSGPHGDHSATGIRASAKRAQRRPSPSRHLSLKRSRYEAAGCQAYWVVDPAVPSLLAWELSRGTYELTAEVRGTDTHRATSPYPVEVCPADLAADE